MINVVVFYILGIYLLPKVDGGVWRIKQRSSDGRLLIGAMHGGFCVVINNEVVAR